MKTLSVIVPSINPDTWRNIFEQLKLSVGNYEFELITVGPSPLAEQELDNHLANEDNFIYIQDFGSPSRSFQRGVESSSGKYIAFIPDDCVLDENGFKKCIDVLEEKPENHGIILMYDEGPGKMSEDPSYWIGRTHEGLRLSGVKDDWRIAPCFMYQTSYFVSMGGLDCSLEHVNMNGHSLAFVTQHNGGEIHYSPSRVFACSWEPPTEATILYQAYIKNDLPKFKSFWKNPNAAESYNISFDNWKDQPEKWPRRYPQ
jgi:hypothetical protein